MTTKEKIINGLTFQVAQPFTEGHVLTAVEAKTLNQVRSENIGNNMRKAVVAAQEAGKSEDEIRALVAAYDAEYTFSTPGDGSSRVVRDPVEREARNIAKDIIKEKLAGMGRKLNTIPEGLTKEEWEEKLEDNISKVAASDAVLKAAKKAVDDKKKRTEALGADLEL
jgi:predicted exporter